jgi:hypothetical protein
MQVSWLNIFGLKKGQNPYLMELGTMTLLCVLFTITMYGEIINLNPYSILQAILLKAHGVVMILY